MKNFLLSLFLICFLNMSAQDSDFNELVQNGIALHDAGDFDKAIAEYQKALEIQPKSSLVHYEIAYSYFSIKDYEKAEEHAEKSINLDSQNLLPSYIVLGNSLDMQGKTKKALKVYEKAIKKFENYLLLYNYAYTNFKAGNVDAAEAAVLDAIENNASHASSHLLLSQIMDQKGNRIAAMLPLYYFLLLEPNSERAAREYRRLTGYMELGVKKTSEKSIDVNLPILDNSEFGPAELLLSMQKATHITEGNVQKSKLELFAETNQSLFSILSELQEDHHGFYWDFYVSLYTDFVNADLVEPFSYFISLSQGDDALNWISANEEHFDQFKNWFEK